MRATRQERSSDFYDVFLSCRHHDARKVDALERKIESYGFVPFRDLNFPTLRNTSDVTRQTITTIRDSLSRATCLIFAYSREPARKVKQSGNSVGVWMPWELGFFDGSISSRIGVYLLDGKPKPFDAKTFFAGSEYLQIYEPLDDSNLEAFLSRNAVRERRIDNVASAFVWLQHLAEECFANPTNVGLGIVEWYVDHAGSFWQEQGNELLGNYLASLKVQIDDMRVAWAPRLRWPLADVILRGLYAAQRSDKPSTKKPASGATGVPKARGGTTGQSIQPAWPMFGHEQAMAQWLAACRSFPRLAEPFASSIAPQDRENVRRRIPSATAGPPTPFGA